MIVIIEMVKLSNVKDKSYTGQFGNLIRQIDSFDFRKLQNMPTDSNYTDNVSSTINAFD